jgi:hypothetical protein
MSSACLTGCAFLKKFNFSLRLHSVIDLDTSHRTPNLNLLPKVFWYSICYWFLLSNRSCMIMNPELYIPEFIYGFGFLVGSCLPK